METISNIATAARNSVFGDATPEKRSTTEPPTANPPGPGTEDQPYDPGNAAETTPASPTTDLTKPKKSGTAAPGSHSALFGLGPAASTTTTTTTTTTTNPTSPATTNQTGNVTGTIDEAAAQLKGQAVVEQKTGGVTATEEDDTGGYVGLKKAAEEEEEKRRNGEGVKSATVDPVAPTAAGVEERESRPRDKKASVADSLGRDISPGEMPDGTHRKSIAEGMPSSTGSTPKKGLGRSKTENLGEGKSGFRDRLKEKFRSKK